MFNSAMVTATGTSSTAPSTPSRRTRLPWLLAASLLVLAAPAVAKEGGQAFRVLPRSVFEVRTGTAGILGGFAHEHLVRADSFDAVVLWNAAHPERSRVEVAVPVRRLRVATEADAEDREEIRRAMLDEVLLADRNPTIRFVSRQVTPIDGGVRILGELTLVGVTRGVVAPLRIRVEGDTLRAEGTFTAKQSHFEMEPYSIKLGTVRVADELTFRVDAVAVRERPLPGAPAGSGSKRVPPPPASGPRGDPPASTVSRRWRSGAT